MSLLNAAENYGLPDFHFAPLLLREGTKIDREEKTTIQAKNAWEDTNFQSYSPYLWSFGLTRFQPSYEINRRWSWVGKMRLINVLHIKLYIVRSCFFNIFLRCLIYILFYFQRSTYVFPYVTERTNDKLFEQPTSGLQEQTDT